MAEGFIVLELLKKLGVVREERGNHAFQRLVVLDSSVLSVGVLLGVLVSLVGGDLLGDLVGDAALHTLGIGKKAAELVIERLEDVGQVSTGSRS